MIYSNMDKPSDNMLLGNSDLIRMTNEQRVAEYNAERDRKLREQSAADRAHDEYMKTLNEIAEDYYKEGAERSDMLMRVKESFMSSCILRLFKESVGFPMNEADNVVARNLVNKFIKENGVNSLINDFAAKNMILSEFSRITTKYYNKVLNEFDSCCDDECKDASKAYTDAPIISQIVVDDFYKELEDVDIEDASKAIRDRVADAVSEFIDTNTANKIEYEEIIKQAQEKADAVGADTELAESYINIAESEIIDRKAHRNSNVFSYMVEGLTTSVFKDPTLQKRYFNEGTVDMDGVVNSAQLIYTMLEMVNTTGMVYMNENALESYLKSL